MVFSSYIYIFANILDARRFNSQTFSITVGKTKPDFIVHVSILSRSPIFACMCDGPYIENTNRHIDLPDEDAESFGWFLEYLYTGTLPTYDTSPLNHRLKLASLYILSDKYQLESLKESIIKYIDNVADPWISAESDVFFTIMHKIYQGVTPTDKYFDSYFSKTAFKVLNDIDGDRHDHLKEILSKGEPFAVDVFYVQRSLYKAQRRLYTAQHLKSDTLECKLAASKLECAGLSKKNQRTSCGA